MLQVLKMFGRLKKTIQNDFSISVLCKFELQNAFYQSWYFLLFCVRGRRPIILKNIDIN